MLITSVHVVGCKLIRSCHVDQFVLRVGKVLLDGVLDAIARTLIGERLGWLFRLYVGMGTRSTAFLLTISVDRSNHVDVVRAFAWHVKTLCNQTMFRCVSTDNDLSQSDGSVARLATENHILGSSEKESVESTSALDRKSVV